jgi:isopenicillin N synthase-like dioxygenase
MPKIITVKEKTIHIFSIFLITIFGAFIVWLYVSEPKSLIEVATKATVTVGTYEVNKAKFDEGLSQFQTENYTVARDFFNQADTEKRDDKTQFYIAYSFYRQGFGKVYSDNNLYKQGLEIASKLNQNFKSDDANLQMKTPAELKNELEEGLKVTASDFNPMKVLRERK